MYGREAASKSILHVAVRFQNGQPVIYSTIADRMYVQTNDSLEMPVFEEITQEFENYLNCNDWEPLTDPSIN